MGSKRRLLSTLRRRIALQRRGQWDCTSCGTKGILAKPRGDEPTTHCPHCNHPRENIPEEQIYIDKLDSKDLSEWECSYCRCCNSHLTLVCCGCAAKKSPARAPAENKNPSQTTAETKGEFSQKMHLKIMCEGWIGTCAFCLFLYVALCAIDRVLPGVLRHRPASRYQRVYSEAESERRPSSEYRPHVMTIKAQRP